jgi:hypothetical protein
VNGVRLGSEGSASLPAPVGDGHRVGFARRVEMEGMVYEGVEVVVKIEMREL